MRFPNLIALKHLHLHLYFLKNSDEGTGQLNEAELEVQTLRAAVEDSSQRARRLEESLAEANKKEAELQSYAEEQDERVEVRPSSAESVRSLAQRAGLSICLGEATNHAHQLELCTSSLCTAVRHALIYPSRVSPKQELNRELKKVYENNERLERAAANAEEQDRIMQDEITALRVRSQHLCALALHTRCRLLSLMERA